MEGNMNFKLKGVVAAAILCLGVGSVFAADCEVTIESDDNMKFNLNEVVADKSCEKFTVTLKHVGSLPKNAMGHNWVLTKTSDFAGVAQDGGKAGLAQNYIKEGDSRVIAYTEIIGGGETTSVTIDDLKSLTPGEDYSFFCSFLGHWSMMKGKFTY